MCIEREGSTWGKVMLILKDVTFVMKKINKAFHAKTFQFMVYGLVYSFQAEKNAHAHGR